MLSHLHEAASAHRGGRRGSARAALAVALIAVGLCGCGSSAKPLTQKQLAARADAVCSQLHDKVKKLGPAKGAEGFVHLTAKLAGFEQQQLNAMRKLVPPKHLASDWKQILEGVQELSATVATVSTDVQAKDKKQADLELRQVAAVEKKTAAIAKRDGFTQCTTIT